MVKRKREEIKVSKVGDDIASFTFKGLSVPEDAVFSVLSSKDGEQTLVHGESEKFIYEGSTDKDQNDYCIAAYDPDTNTVELYPSTLVSIGGSVKNRKELGPSVRQANVRNAAQRNALGEAFGTKKAKKAITDLERNRIEADKLEDLEMAIVDSVGTVTSALPTKEEREAQLKADRPIPPYDLETTKVENVFPLAGIIPPKEYDAIRVNVIVKERDPAKRQALLPHKTSPIISTRLEQLAAKPGDHTDLLKQIYYAALLLAVYDNKRINNKTMLAAKINNPPEILISGMLERFAVSKAGQFGKTKDRSFTIDPVHENKLLSYLLALLLRIDNYLIEVNSLARELSLKPSKLTMLLQAMGCNVKAPSQTQCEALGLIKTQSASYKVAILTAPLQLPDLTKRKRAGGR